MSHALKFLIEDIFDIMSRGPVVTGKIQSGTIQLGGKALVITKSGVIPITIVSIEKFNQPGLEEVSVSDEDVGLELSGVTKDQIGYKDVITDAGDS